MTRTIPIEVRNEYVIGAGVPVGAAGSFNDVLLEIKFSEMWDGLTKKITWLNAEGGDPTLTILTSNMLKGGSLRTYLVPIPAEPKAIAGEMTMTIKGEDIQVADTSSGAELALVAVGDDDEDESVTVRATVSVSAHFEVLHSDYDNNADASGDVTPSQAAQLQAEIDDILDTISDSEAYAVGKRGGVDVESTDPAYHNNAKYYAGNAGASATNAATSESNAAASATSAATSASNAAASESNASSSATSAGNSATSAGNSAVSASGSASSAASSASSATSSASEALGYKNAAATSASNAATSESNAASSEATASAAASSASSSESTASAAASTATSAASTATSAASTATSAASSASGSASAASTSASNAAAAAATYPYIKTENKHWMVWDVEDQSYEDTNVIAEGDDGRGVQSFELISGTHAPGTFDTYQLTYTDGSSTTMQVYNGANGQGSGDMVAAVYDPDNGGRQVAFENEAVTALIENQILKLTLEKGYEEVQALTFENSTGVTIFGTHDTAHARVGATTDLASVKLASPISENVTKVFASVITEGVSGSNTCKIYATKDNNTWSEITADQENTLSGSGTSFNIRAVLTKAGDTVPYIKALIFAIVE